MMNLRRFAATAALLFGLALPAAPAFAQAEYPGGRSDEVAGVVINRPENPAPAAVVRQRAADPVSVGGLAVTGADALGLAVVGGGLAALGYVLVRGVRRSSSTVS